MFKIPIYLIKLEGFVGDDLYSSIIFFKIVYQFLRKQKQIINNETFHSKKLMNPIGVKGPTFCFSRLSINLIYDENS